MKQARKGKGWNILYESVERRLAEALGADWFEDRDLEAEALAQCNAYLAVYKASD